MKKGKGKICSNLKKIFITITCIITLFISMPVKSKADSDILGDALDLLLQIPDSVMWIANHFVVGTDSSTSIKLDFKGWGGKRKNI